jgi:hypothetical protein
MTKGPGTTTSHFIREIHEIDHPTVDVVAT